MSQLLSIVHVEDEGSIDTSEKTDDDDDDDADAQSLERVITKFKTLLGKKGLSNDNVTNIQVNNVQVIALQAMITSQLLALHE